MRVSRLFIDQCLKVNGMITLNEKQSHYLSHVLRLKVKQSIIIFNGLDEFEYQSEVIKIGKKVELLIQSTSSTHNESCLNITILQALSKNEHIDLMIQKCTELGVNSIVIFNSQRTQIPLKHNKIEKKLSHWHRIAQSACEQCGRSIVPNIEFTPSLESALSFQAASQRIMLDFEGASINQSIQKQDKGSIDLLLGAEGGLTVEEIEFALKNNFIKVRLGPRILRTETAAISAVSLLQMLHGDLN